MKKTLISIAAAVLVLVLITTAGAWVVLRNVLTEQFLVEQIESSLNVRAEIKKLNVSLFSALSSVEIEGVSLGARDSFADAAAPLKDRTPMKSAAITIQKVDLKFSLLPLIQRRFELKRFLLIEPSISLTFLAGGGTSLKPLFQKPLIVAGKPNPAVVDAAKDAATSDAAKTESEDKPFSARDLPLAADLREIGIRNGTVSASLQKTGNLIRLSGLNLVIDSIDIDPADLDHHNAARLDASADASVFSANGQEAALLLIRSSGAVVPFDAKTGAVNTGLEYAATLKKDSYITGLVVFDQLAGDLPILSQTGFSWKKLSERAALLRDVNVRVRYSHGLITFLDDSVFPTANYDLLLKKGSSLNAATAEHNFDASVRASESESRDILARFDRGIEKKLKGQSAEQIRSRVLGSLIKDGRVELPFASAGNLSNPTVKLLAEIPSLTEILTGSLKDVIQNKLDQKIPGAAKEILNKLPF